MRDLFSGSQQICRLGSGDDRLRPHGWGTRGQCCLSHPVSFSFGGSLQATDVQPDPGMWTWSCSICGFWHPWKARPRPAARGPPWTVSAGGSDHAGLSVGSGWSDEKVWAAPCSLRAMSEVRSLRLSRPLQAARLAPLQAPPPRRGPSACVSLCASPAPQVRLAAGRTPPQLAAPDTCSCDEGLWPPGGHHSAHFGRWGTVAVPPFIGQKAGIRDRKKEITSNPRKCPL